jgi:hypothetical protein
VINGSIGNACQLLSLAVEGALLQDGSFGQRLLRALRGNVGHLSTLDRVMPAELQGRFDVLWQACNRESDPTGERGSPEVTMAKMSDEEAQKWLGELFSLYVHLAEHLYLD